MMARACLLSQFIFYDVSFSRYSAAARKYTGLSPLHTLGSHLLSCYRAATCKLIGLKDEEYMHT